MRTNLVKWILAAAMSMVAAQNRFNQVRGTGFRATKAPKYPKHRPAGSKLSRFAFEGRLGLRHGR